MADLQPARGGARQVQGFDRAPRGLSEVDWARTGIRSASARPAPLLSRPGVQNLNALYQGQAPTGASNSPPPYSGLETENLRRQQAEFNQERRRVERGNWWLAFGAGLPVAAGLALGAPTLVASPLLRRAAFNIYPPRRALNRIEKIPIWKEGRNIFERANKMSAKKMGSKTPPIDASAADSAGLSLSRTARQGVVHHRIPNEHFNKLPGADPNRLANLQAIPEEVHSVVSAEWGKFLRSLGRHPTPAELIRFARKMDRLIEPYALRRGLPRPPPRIRKLPKGKP